MRSTDEPLHLETRRCLPQAPANIGGVADVAVAAQFVVLPGWIPDSLDSGLTEKCGQLRTSDDVVAALIRLSIHEEAANGATHLALHVPVHLLPDPKGGQRVLLRPGERRNPRLRLIVCVAA